MSGQERRPATAARRRASSTPTYYSLVGDSAPLRKPSRRRTRCGGDRLCRRARLAGSWTSARLPCDARTRGRGLRVLPTRSSFASPSRSCRRASGSFSGKGAAMSSPCRHGYGAASSFASRCRARLEGSSSSTPCPLRGGDVSVGEFELAVGSPAPLPELGGSSGEMPWTEVLASRLFFAGLALALGGWRARRSSGHACGTSAWRRARRYAPGSPSRPPARFSHSSPWRAVGQAADSPRAWSRRRSRAPSRRGREPYERRARGGRPGRHPRRSVSYAISRPAFPCLPQSPSRRSADTQERRRARAHACLRRPVARFSARLGGCRSDAARA